MSIKKLTVATALLVVTIAASANQNDRQYDSSRINASAPATAQVNHSSADTSKHGLFDSSKHALAAADRTNVYPSPVDHGLTRTEVRQEMSEADADSAQAWRARGNR